MLLKIIVPMPMLTMILFGACPTNTLAGQTVPARSSSCPPRQDPTAKETIAENIVVHKMNSPNQSGPTEIHVLSPSISIADADRRVLYLLPVEKMGEQKWGNALQEIIQHDLHNKYGLICVYPTFSDLPWFANHPTDRSIQQETYLLECVIPFVEQHYDVKPSADKRLLIGFSKSGYGAWSLLLRNPGMFGKAAAWDAPLMMQEPNRYGMGPIYGSQENFQGYQISELLKTAPGTLGDSPRLIHGRSANFQIDHQQINELARKLNLKLHYENGPLRTHSWNSGWLPQLLFRLAGPETGGSGKSQSSTVSNPPD